MEPENTNMSSAHEAATGETRLYCEKCGVYLTGKRYRCPLCGRIVSNDEEENPVYYPEIPLKTSYNLIFKTSTFAAIVCIIIINIINSAFIPHLALYIPLTVITLCAWLIVNIGYHKRKNIPKGILYLAIISLAVCIWLDYQLGWRHWSVNYVLPIMSSSLTIFYFVLSLADRKNASTYGIYFLMSMVGPLLTSILYLTGVIYVRYFAVFGTAICVGIFFFQLIFRWKSFSSELTSRFHL